MKIVISSNFKRYFKTHIDFVDHYLLNYFEARGFSPVILPNKLGLSIKLIKSMSRPDLIILPGGNDVIKKDKLTNIRLKVEKRLLVIGNLNPTNLSGFLSVALTPIYYFFPLNLS